MMKSNTMYGLIAEQASGLGYSSPDILERGENREELELVAREMRREADESHRYSTSYHVAPIEQVTIWVVKR